jgi:hypothetical protein
MVSLGPHRRDKEDNLGRFEMDLATATAFLATIEEPENHRLSIAFHDWLGG